MDVQVVSSIIIFPGGDPHATEPTIVPFTIFDKYEADMHIAILHAFGPPTATNAAIKRGLAETLVHFPTLAGRLGPAEIILGDGGGGALLVEATVASDLADHIPLEPSPELLRLHPPTVEAEHLLQVQLNRFRCGGLVVGVTANHRIADGLSMGTFFVAWGQSVRGVRIDPVPVYDRSWLEPRCPPRCEFEHWGVQFVPPSPANHNVDESSPTPGPPPVESKGSVCNVKIPYSSDFINSSLKASVLPEKYTTFETLLAHVWRKITVARGLGDEEYTEINVAVNGRRRLRPMVPAEFFGNLVLDAHPRAKVKDLLDGGLAGAARIIRDAVRAISDEYFRSFIDFGEVHGGEELNSVEEDHEEMFLCPNLEVDSWLGLHFHEVDFGGGLCAFVPTWIPMEGVVILVPTLGGDDGGVDVVVTLFQEQAELLRKISHSID